MLFKPTTQFIDQEFGIIRIRRFKDARAVKLRIDAQGDLRISMPPRVPLLFARELIDQSREHIRRNVSQLRTAQAVLRQGDLIGKAHRLVLRQGAEVSSRLVGAELRVTLPPNVDPQAPTGQKIVRQAALKALRTQAKAYLSRRLQALAATHGFAYSKIRFGAAGTRWGSCSSSGTISLNIWLMQLPFELIDYVLIHELCHTRHMDHSPRFWGLVSGILPNYKALRRQLKAQQPYA